MEHKINRAKAAEALKAKGWYINSYGAWETDKFKTPKEENEDFIQAFEEAIECPLVQGKK